MSTREHERCREPGDPIPPWRLWGPYVSERSWGTVREDYSSDGDAWHFLSHDLARSKAYRWGEDGLGGICDRYQILVFALGLWNGHDPILKERAFGLIPSEGNHGEDLKEYYFYLDSTPTHSYMKYLYKYPQTEFPYRQLVEENGRRNGQGQEFELVDTGVFGGNRYFDVFVEYAKVSPEDLAIRIEAFNRGPERAPLHILPHLWFRNTWSWAETPGAEPVIRMQKANAAKASSDPFLCLVADDSTAQPLRNLPFPYRLGPRYLYAPTAGTPLFTDNETNMSKVFGPGAVSRSPYVKDAFHRHIIDGEACVNPALEGTKACIQYRYDIPAGESAVLVLRLSPDSVPSPFRQAEEMIRLRRAEADEFYDIVHPPKATADERGIQRQAFAGMLWSKQIYLFDVNRWLEGDNPNHPPPASRVTIRNVHWRHLNSMRILSMPDKWEYPWFAAWDLAFHCMPLTLVDPEFAKEQLWVMLFEQFQHSNGQLPAYEWEFSDLNPPVHAWAVWRVYNMDRIRSGKADRAFLEKCFHKLLINFAWWINKVDAQGNNVFEGGFLGLDNITVVDRSDKFPGGAVLEQSDATGWMGMFCLNMMRIALELAKENRVYEGLATKFFQHYVYIGAAMKRMGGQDYDLWDERDGFFYDVLRYQDGSFHKFRVRSLVGLIPLYAVERLEEDWIRPFSEFRANVEWFLKNRQDLVQRCVHTIEREGGRVHVLTIVNEDQMKRLLERIADPEEFLSDWGLRSLSKFHERSPFIFGSSEVRYDPGEASCKIKGGNSNWRGPVWFPTSFLMIESLRKLGTAFGPSVKVNVPGLAEESITLGGISKLLANRLIKMFLRGQDGRRPIYGRCMLFQEDPHWRDYIMFHEFFHGETGEGLGASHQTGWTGLVASLIDEWRR